jgi:hypothetical protein
METCKSSQPSPRHFSPNLPVLFITNSITQPKPLCQQLNPPINPSPRHHGAPPYLQTQSIAFPKPTSLSDHHHPQVHKQPSHQPPKTINPYQFPVTNSAINISQAHGFNTKSAEKRKKNEAHGQRGKEEEICKFLKRHASAALLFRRRRRSNLPSRKARAVSTVAATPPSIFCPEPTAGVDSKIPVTAAFPLPAPSAFLTIAVSHEA